MLKINKHINVYGVLLYPRTVDSTYMYTWILWFSRCLSMHKHAFNSSHDDYSMNLYWIISKLEMWIEKNEMIVSMQYESNICINDQLSDPHFILVNINTTGHCFSLYTYTGISLANLMHGRKSQMMQTNEKKLAIKIYFFQNMCAIYLKSGLKIILNFHFSMIKIMRYFAKRWENIPISRPLMIPAYIFLCD